jgi:hypothetical protein
MGDPLGVDFTVGERLAAGVRFLFGWRGRKRIGGVRMAGEVDPAFGWVDGVMPAAWFDTRRDRQTGDSEACQLTLTAPEATDRIAHQQDLGEVFTAQGRAAKLLAGAELTLDGNAMVGVQSQVRDAFLGGVRAVSPSAGAFVFVL